MLNTSLKNTIAALGFATFALSAASISQAGTLENLERERAQVLDTLLDPSLSAEQRQQKLGSARHRLVDMERMVLRDKSLEGKNTPEVRVAFKNYDLTFIAHAAIEKDVSLSELWLDQIGVTTNSLMTSQMGRK